jgi:hypothetical protein
MRLFRTLSTHTSSLIDQLIDRPTPWPYPSGPPHRTSQPPPTLTAASPDTAPRPTRPFLSMRPTPPLLVPMEGPPPLPHRPAGVQPLVGAPPLARLRPRRGLLSPPRPRRPARQGLLLWKSTLGNLFGSVVDWLLEGVGGESDCREVSASFPVLVGRQRLAFSKRSWTGRGRPPPVRQPPAGPGRRRPASQCPKTGGGWCMHCGGLTAPGRIEKGDRGWPAFSRIRKGCPSSCCCLLSLLLPHPQTAAVVRHHGRQKGIGGCIKASTQCTPHCEPPHKALAAVVRPKLPPSSLPTEPPPTGTTSPSLPGARGELPPAAHDTAARS